MIIEIWIKDKYAKNEEADIIAKLAHAGAKPAFAKISRLYRVDGDFEKKDFKKIAEEILIDPVTEEYSLAARKLKGKNLFRPLAVLAAPIADNAALFRVEICLKDSITDVVGESVKETIADVIDKKPGNVRFGHAYYFSIDSERKLKHAVSEVLINELIHTFRITELLQSSVMQ
ncbi:MAG: phosphoribosylformylglycinamidine synthase subunit PurS [Elusimicrobia bacterium]|nr:phosphoribosylformylglycinamidine synthase subunit PurS [Elusimicrobiota bacterium]